MFHWLLITMLWMLPTKLGFNSWIISIKRNNAIKAFENLGLKSANEEDARDVIKEEIANAFNFKRSEIEIKRDGSLEPDEEEDYAFEWATPTMQFTPTNIQRCVNGLHALLKDGGYYTNSTCGFHVHLSFPDISDADCAWIVCKLSVDDDMLNKILSFKDIDFYNDDYASIDWLEELGDLIREGSFSGVKNYMSTDKYRALHIHPQGTIEWRGPRDFLNEYQRDKGEIIDFFKLLHDFVIWMSQTIASNDIVGFDKKHFFSLVYGGKYDDNKLITNFNWKKKQDKLDRYIKGIINQGLNMDNPDELIKTLVHYKDPNNSPRIISQLVNAITDLNNDPRVSALIANIFERAVELDDYTFKVLLMQLVNTSTVFSTLRNTLSTDCLYKFMKKVILSGADTKYITGIVIRDNFNFKVDNAVLKLIYENIPNSEKYFNRIFSFLRYLAMYGESISNPEYINDYEIYSSIFDSLKGAARTLQMKDPMMSNLQMMLSHDIMLVYIRRCCIKANDNPVLASLLNSIFDSIIKSSNNLGEINNQYIKDIISLCKHFKYIIKTGKDDDNIER